MGIDMRDDDASSSQAQIRDGGNDECAVFARREAVAAAARAGVRWPSLSGQAAMSLRVPTLGRRDERKDEREERQHKPVE